MLRENTKLIIATNKPIDEIDGVDFESDIMHPSQEYSATDPVVLERPMPYEVIYETYKAASERRIPVLIPVGGDGTINWHLNEMDLYAPNTVLAPFPGGTANDISTTLNGADPRLERIFKKGHLKEARPLVIENGGQTRKALGYIGLGITGLCAQLINDRPSTEPSKFRDGLAAFKGLRKSRKFKVREDEDELSYREIAAVNTRMASCLWPKRENISILDDHFNLVLSKSYFSTAGLAVKGLAKKIVGRRIEDGQTLQLEKPADGKRIIGQTDGEPFVIEDGQITISKQAKPIKLFSLNHFLAR